MGVREKEVNTEVHSPRHRTYLEMKSLKRKKTRKILILCERRRVASRELGDSYIVGVVHPLRFSDQSVAAADQSPQPPNAKLWRT